MFDLEQRTPNACLDILNFPAECLGPEIDENVLPCTRTDKVGHPAVSIPDSGPADGVILHSPTVLCSAACTRRTVHLWNADHVRRTLHVRPVLLHASCCAFAAERRIPFRAMPSNLLVAQHPDLSRNTHGPTCTMRVPLFPCIASLSLPSSAIIAVRPPFRTNLMAAVTFGPMLPSLK